MEGTSLFSMDELKSRELDAGILQQHLQDVIEGSLKFNNHDDGDWF